MQEVTLTSRKEEHLGSMQKQVSLLEKVRTTEQHWYVVMQPNASRKVTLTSRKAERMGSMQKQVSRRTLVLLHFKETHDEKVALFLF